MYSIQALWTAANLKRPITYVICNNRSYRILKERLVSMRGTEKFLGMDLRDPEIDFVALSQSLGVPARRVADAQDVVPALRAALASGGPAFGPQRVSAADADIPSSRSVIIGFAGARFPNASLTPAGQSGTPR